MPYLVIARKWRPQTFGEVVGQPHVTKTLQNAIGSQRIAHAYLFAGARGVGKTSVARILAKSLNCERGASPVPCNACSNCREITQGHAVDVIEIDGASNRGIDSIRELRETVRYRPAKGRYKIYIIDEVHMLTTEAFNALLKTLEEPPEHVLFLLATTEPHKIPSTILSRCQRFDFRRIGTVQLVEHLKDIAAKEQIPLSEAVLYAIAREADGSMRDAQSLLEQLLAFSGDGLSDEEILDVLGVIDRRSVHRVGEAILGGDARCCLEVVEEVYRRGTDSRRFCRQLCDHFRNLLVLSLGEGAARLELPEEELAPLRAAAGRTTPESLHLYFQMTLKGEEEIRRSTLPRMALEMLLLRLTQLPRLNTLEGVLEKLANLEGRLVEGAPMGASEPVQDWVAPPRRVPPVPPSEEVPVGPDEAESPEVPQSPELVCERGDTERVPPPSPSPVGVGEIPERWAAFVRSLQGLEPLLAAKLARSRVVGASETGLDVEVLEVFEGSLKEAPSLSRLTEAAATFFGRRFDWTIRAAALPQAEAHGASSRRSAKGNPKRMVMEHPVVLQALEVLGGELVDVRPLRGSRAAGRREEPLEKG